MATADYPDFRPVGDSIRDIINPALADERKQQIQMDILDQIFGDMAEDLPACLKENLTGLFNEVAYAEWDDTNRTVLTLLTLTDQQGQPMYSPVIEIGLPIVTQFTDFFADDIRNLPGYIKFHEAARDANVAVRLSGLLKEDSGAPKITIDCSKTYEQGAMENASIYPNLPEPVAPVMLAADLKTAKAFTFK